MTLPLPPTNGTVEQTSNILQPATTEQEREADTEAGDLVNDFDVISKFWVDIVSDTDSEE